MIVKMASRKKYSLNQLKRITHKFNLMKNQISLIILKKMLQALFHLHLPKILMNLNIIKNKDLNNKNSL